MILVYPMLTSPNVSSLVLPGVCKALERLVIIYDMNKIASSSGLGNLLNIGIKTGVAAKPLFRSKNEYFMIEAGNKGTKDEDEEEEIKIKDVGKELAGKKGFNMPSSFEKIISMEPTWIEWTGATGTRIIGIKVIPVAANADENMGSLMMNDATLRGFDTFITGIKRKFLRVIYGVLRYAKTHLPGFWSTDLTGDPEKDVIFASTKYKKNIFCLLSLADLENDKMFHQAGGMSRLFYLGWNSILVADDVNKELTCCIKQFDGLCSKLSYSTLYANFGKEHSKVYADMDEIKKNTNPFFRSRFKPTKLFSESLASEKLEKYKSASECVDCEEV
jgi:hypothetical protein